jgi:hypothetical protein
LKLPDPQIHYAMSLLKGIGRSRIGDLAPSCGKTLISIAGPQAVKVSIQLQGLVPETFENGSHRHLSRINKALNDYRLSDLEQEQRLPDFINISTDNGRILCIAVIKHLGIPVGVAAAISEPSESATLPLDESLYLCVSQLNARIHAILSPGSPSAVEVLCRRLLRNLQDTTVKAVGAQLADGGDFWISALQIDKNISCRETDPIIAGATETPKDGREMNQDALKSIWPEPEIDAGIWVTDLPGYFVAIGFPDKKAITKQVRGIIEKQVENLAVADTDYIIRSFEKLKADFKKLVKSERAAAISETAVTVNHEINNPLTAILGNTQLLLMARDTLPAEAVAKLETIEKSAIQIRETTAKLMSIIEPVKSSYAAGLNMIDIEKSKKKKSL